MRIECKIDYWEEGCLVFEPEKVVGIVRKYFPQVIFDETNLSRFYLEEFFQTVKKKGLEPPDFIIDKKWGLAFQNGPTYKFEVNLENQAKITGVVKRFGLEFESEKGFTEEIENKIIECLKALNYGQILSDFQSINFVQPLEDLKGYWKLR